MVEKKEKDSVLCFQTPDPYLLPETQHVSLPASKKMDPINRHIPNKDVTLKIRKIKSVILDKASSLTHGGVDDLGGWSEHTLYGRPPGEEVVPGEVQVHQRLLPRDVQRAFEAAGHPIALKHALLVARWVPLDLLGPLTHVVEVMDAHTPVVVMDTAHDVISTLYFSNDMRKGPRKESEYRKYSTAPTHQV